MSAIIDKLADDLAKDAIEAADALGDDQMISTLAKTLATSSATAEEAFLTAARVRMALIRAREVMNDRITKLAEEKGIE